MPLTTRDNLINTEVFAQSVQARLGDAIKLYPLAFVQNFSGQQAGSIHVPTYQYLGDATVIGEGVPIPTDLLTQNTEALDIIKVGKAVEITDEARFSGFGDPVGEAERQIVQSIANGIENQMYGALAGATLTYANPTDEITGDTVLNATVLFGEEAMDGEKALVINPANLGSVRRDGNYQENKLFDLDIVVSNRVPVGFAYVIKPEGLGIYLGSETTVEQDRDILAKTTVVSASQHFATHLRDASKVVAITLPTV